MASASGTAATAGINGPASPAQATETAATRTAEAQPLDLRDHLEQSREALSRRLGEALAARVLSQVERGDWQVRLSVTPQHLGPIDIDLQMRGNRLEAQFQVANAQTQSLIQDSLPRLRDAVGASGMDLASAWVSGGLSDRNRGNPTPGQPDDPASVALKEASDDEQAVSGVESVETRGPGWTPRPGAVDILI
jgi:flagellar hook-length control protein FliK